MGAQHNFAQVPRADIPRSTFNRSHNYKTTFDAGYLVPVFVDEMLPGDTFTLNMAAFARLSTPLVPFMDNMYLDVFFFAVPNRLLWSNWKKFNGEQTNPGDSTDYLLPQVTAPGSGGWTAGSIGDYLGLPTGVNSLSSSALPFRAYNLIWNEWFRDQNLQNSLTVNTGNGPDANTDYTIKRRGKRHDYFTSSLPNPQKGPAVTLPLGTSAPITFKSSTPYNTQKVRDENGALVTSFSTFGTDAGGALKVTTPSTKNAIMDPSGNWIADLSTATAATINQLRQSFQIQKLYERDARGGTRYTEVIKAHFGVTSPDARQQRPEYLGGGSFDVNLSPVPQTSVSAATPQGNLAAFGTASSSRAAGFTYSATEHCTLIGLVSARADMNYQQGIEKMWLRSTRFDFYWPALSHIGEQAVLSKEIYCDGTAGDNNVFGYQERYAEYRYKPNLITGEFRSNFVATLDFWHLAQKFTSRPTLNSTFIEENPPVDRVLAVPSEAHFLFDAAFSYRCARPMPVYSVPGLMDHF